jgi:hypothetical protein
MMTFRTRLRVLALAVIVTAVAASLARLQEDYPMDPDWPALHAKDLARWSRSSGLSIPVLKELLRAAGREDDADYRFQNVDARSLKRRGQVLLSICEFGTGNCMTVYVIDKRTPYYRKIWEAPGGYFCTESVLGAPTASVGPRGEILVKFPIGNWNGELPFNRKGTKLDVLEYVWTGKTYELHAEREFPRYEWNGKDWEVLGKEDVTTE